MALDRLNKSVLCTQHSGIEAVRPSVCYTFFINYTATRTGDSFDFDCAITVLTVLIFYNI